MNFKVCRRLIALVLTSVVLVSVLEVPNHAEEDLVLPDHEDSV